MNNRSVIERKMRCKKLFQEKNVEYNVNKIPLIKLKVFNTYKKYQKLYRE